MSAMAPQRKAFTGFTSRHASPIANADRVQRVLLTTRLMESRERLLLVVAPPGFGKTTLISQWNEHDERRFAWVQLDSGLADPTALWSYIVESVRHAEPTFAPTAEWLESQLAGAEPSTAAAQVAEALEELDDEIVIVLDDYQRV